MIEQQLKIEQERTAEQAALHARVWCQFHRLLADQLEGEEAL
jgi:hypothetical protein